MRKRKFRSILAGAGAAAFMAGCGNTGIPGDLMQDLDSARNLEEPSGGSSGNLEEPSGDNGKNPGGAEAVTDFGVRLLQQVLEGDKNVLLSPLSVASALAMTANGAEGDTLSQMEAVLGMPVQELSEWLHTYREALPRGEKYRLDLANAIWFAEKEGFTVEQEFLQANQDYFDAGLYQVPFEASVAGDINQWVEERTDGRIREIVTKVSPDAVMYLVNALVFDAQWQEIYRENQVRERDFTREDGTVQKVEMMHSAESQYLTDGQAEGFIKYYEEGEYAYVALLPREGLTVSEYVASLTGEGLRQMLLSPVSGYVDAAVPKYKSEYGISLEEALQEMGMQNAFDELRADFSGIGYSVEGPVYISQVLHKTFMAVDERGTRAGAATVVEMEEGGGGFAEEIQTVYLDRPFLYMIVDCRTMVPVFMGTVMDPGAEN